MNVFNSLLASIVGALITGSIALYVFRKNMGHMRTEKTEKQKEALRKSIEPLYAELGTLVYRSSQSDYNGMIEQIRLMTERRQRGEYDMPLAPAIMQDEWMNILSLFDMIRVHADDFKDTFIQHFLMGHVVSHLAHLIQQNLNRVRQQ